MLLSDGSGVEVRWCEWAWIQAWVRLELVLEVLG